MAPAPAKKAKTSEHLRGAWPLLVELVRPRRHMLAGGFALMIVNRLCAMVLPVST
jgi:hypothetical protein